MHHILIVDDHPLYREGMVSALRAQMADVEVLGANSDEAQRLGYLRPIASGP